MIFEQRFFWESAKYINWEQKFDYGLESGDWFAIERRRFNAYKGLGPKFETGQIEFIAVLFSQSTNSQCTYILQKAFCDKHVDLVYGLKDVRQPSLAVSSDFLTRIYFIDQFRRVPLEVTQNDFDVCIEFSRRFSNFQSTPTCIP